MKHFNFTKMILSALVSVLFFANLSCGNKRADREIATGSTHGSVTVDFATYGSGSSPVPAVTLGEHVAGNFAADAMFAYAISEGLTDVQFAVANSGGLRGGTSSFIAAGDWTDATVATFLPFGNMGAVMTVTGVQLKEIFERSASALNAANPVSGSSGRFLQVSSQVKVVYSVAGTRQVVSCTSGSTCVVTTQGTRVTSLKINNVEYNPSGTYTFIGSDFLACSTAACQAGTSSNDGYVVFRKNNWEDLGMPAKVNIGEDLGEAIKYYLSAASPVTPVVSGRITINP